jgi:hypothetical protein
VNKLRLRIVSYDNDFGRTYYVVNVKTDKLWEVQRSFLNRKDAESWKSEQEQNEQRGLFSSRS